MLFYYNNPRHKPQYAWIKQLTEIPYHNYDMGIKKNIMEGDINFNSKMYFLKKNSPDFFFDTPSR